MFSSVQVRCFAAVAVASLISSAAQAGVVTEASIGLGNNYDAGSSIGRLVVWETGYVPGQVVSTGAFSTSFTGLDSANHTQAGQFNGEAWALSDHGVLKAYATGTLANAMVNAANPIYTDGWTINPDGVPTQFFTGASAYFSDAISGLGGVSSIRIKLGVTATISQPAAPSFLAANSGLSVMQTTGLDRYDFVNPSLVSVWNSYQSVPADVLSDPIPVVGGVAHFGFVLGANVNFDPGHWPALEGGTFSGTVDASHTVLLDMVYGYNAIGQQVSLAGAVAGSGTVYSYAPAAAVPEPTAWLLMSIGLVGIIGARRSRSRR